MATDVSVLTRRTPALTRRLGHPAIAVGPRRDRVVFVILAFVALLFVLAVMVWPTRIPLVSLAPLVLLSGLYLSDRHLVGLYILIGIGVLATVPQLGGTAMVRTLMVSSMFALMAMMVIVSSSRVRVGSTGFHGENLFVELRDRIARSAQLPGLPQGWTAESAVYSAHGEGFSGDFMVADLTHNGRHLEVALVDVSGKGREAGTRSLLLSGALGALLGSLPPSAFLNAANSYLVRQGWEEGFATAVHVDVNLDTGEFSVGNAGHPAPVRYSVGTGTWEILEGGRGPVLGIMQGVTFARTRGTLTMGDALMIYSDGIIESRGHDLTEGTDRMLGAASGAMIRHGDSITDAVVSSARSGEADDRAVFVITRR
ncbi:PP2C family protein-serine/threonine phosphatase [Knoellia sinensis]|uniref:PP2C family protein-serine/threonine phosphatase n=1 Tax=Knoellia sinensis TaxID=136100 RepID=UPI00068C96EB|nr:PP2C family protein-serine/threonine phosphatase [Knoellia sinensis]